MSIMTWGQPQNVGNKVRRHPNVKTPRRVCSTERCCTYLMNFTGISSVYPACPLASHWLPPQTGPVKNREPDLLMFPSPGRGPPSDPTLTPLLVQSLLSPVGPGWGLLPGLVLGLGPPHFPTRERGMVKLILWTSPPPPPSDRDGLVHPPTPLEEGRGRVSGDSSGHRPSRCLSHIPKGGLN